MRYMGNLGFVMAVTLVTWLGIFSYLLYIDRSLRRLESVQYDDDDAFRNWRSTPTPMLESAQRDKEENDL